MIDNLDEAPHPNALVEETEADTSIMSVDADSYYGEGSATLGDRLAAARLQAGLTQAGLAARLGVGAKVVSSWENDRSEPRANRLTMLSGLLGVSVSWLLTGGGEGVAPPGEAAPGATGLRAESFVFDRPTGDLTAARAFYGDGLGCAVSPAEAGAATLEGEGSQDVAFFGAVLRLRPAPLPPATAPVAATDPDGAPIAPLSVSLAWEDWQTLVERLRAAGTPFTFTPAVHGVGEPRERAVFVVADPDGGLIAFRSERTVGAAS